MSEMIRGEKLQYEYHIHNESGEIEHSHRALEDVDVQVKPGEFVAILGHNGSGKSTLAKHMNALLLPSKGTLWIKGMDTKDEDKLWQIRQNTGMVFQNPDNQIIAAIVEEDVAFGPENLGIDPADIRKRVDKALDTVEMSAYAKHSPTKLSGGQKQRIAIAGVLAMRPDCIVLDEPTAMLDPSGRLEVLDKVKDLHREGITIILITHYMEEAALAERVIVMEEGRIVMNGTPKEIFSRVEMMKSLGLDVPQVTELSYMLSKSGINIDSSILNVEEMVEAVWQLKSKS